MSEEIAPIRSGRRIEWTKGRDLPRAAFELRFVAGALPVIAALLLSRPSTGFAPSVWIAALALCSIGIVIRAWATVHNRYAQGSRKTLATSGPYRWVRNPLYLGNLAIVAAGLVASQCFWLVPLGLFWLWAVYDRAVRHEEGRLESRYGDRFSAYRAQTPRWWPRQPNDVQIERQTPHFARCLLMQSRAIFLLAPFLLREEGLLRLLGRG